MYKFYQDDPKPRGAALPALLPPPGTETADELELEVTGEGWAVILFNDETHSTDEVATQIVLATGCPWENAVDVMRRVQRHGQAVVTIADEAEAQRVASILRRIALRVAVEQI